MRHQNFNNGSRRQQGAALVTGLIMLLVLTVLAVSGMNTSTLELTMAGNVQYQQNAFQAAETGIDIIIDNRNFTTVAPTVLPVTPLSPTDTTQSVASFQNNTPVPDAAFSMGEDTGAVAAFHFDIVAVGNSARNATSTNNQSFYVVGPGGS
jgi:type IV pilus assembly protein PilX